QPGVAEAGEAHPGAVAGKGQEAAAPAERRASAARSAGYACSAGSDRGDIQIEHPASAAVQVEAHKVAVDGGEEDVAAGDAAVVHARHADGEARAVAVQGTG